MISVIMSVYNSELFLKDAVESILTQTYGDFEFIITDDCSTDNSFEILEEFAKKDKRITILRNEKNIGLTKSLNKMLDLAKGEYIARMDADDISLPKRFEKQIDFMGKNPDIGVCGSNIRYFGKINQITNHPLKHDEIKVELLFKCVMMHPSIIMRKSVLDKFNFRYDESFKISQDYELWSRMINYTKFANIKEVLLDYRFESTNITNTHKEDFKTEILKRIFYKQIDDFEINNPKEKEILFDIIISNKDIENFKTLATIEKLLFKVLNNNQKNKTYENTIFRIKLSELWFKIYTRSTKFGIKVFFSYIKSPFSKDYNPGIKYKFKFLVKSLIKYKKRVTIG